MTIFHSRSSVKRCGVDLSRGSMTVQSDRSNFDPNRLMSQYHATGISPLSVLAGRKGAFYADVSEFGNYRDSLERVMRAQDHFNALPSALRDRFANDPARYLDFVSNPKNIDEMITLGIAKKVKVDAPAQGGSVAEPPRSAAQEAPGQGTQS